MNTTDLEREYLQEMLDLFQTRVSTELNRFVRKVTAWGSVGLAWTVIVGLYGMNFTAHARALLDLGIPGRPRGDGGGRHHPGGLLPPARLAVTRQQPARPTRSRVGLAPRRPNQVSRPAPPNPEQDGQSRTRPPHRSDNLLAERSDVPNNPTYLTDQTRRTAEWPPMTRAPTLRYSATAAAARRPQPQPRLNAGKPSRAARPHVPWSSWAARAGGRGGPMNVKAVVFGFFVLLAATLNFGFVIGDIDDPSLHNVYELFAAVLVNLIATALKFRDRTHLGAMHLATSLAADLQAGRRGARVGLRRPDLRRRATPRQQR